MLGSEYSLEVSKSALVWLWDVERDPVGQYCTRGAKVRCRRTGPGWGVGVGVTECSTFIICCSERRGSSRLLTATRGRAGRGAGASIVGGSGGLARAVTR